MKSLLDAAFDLVFPVSCLRCSVAGTILCDACIGEFPRVSRKRVLDDNLYALFDYQDEYVKRALWWLKYRGRKQIAKSFARHLLDELLSELSERALFENFTDPMLIPIPLSRGRLWKRGFNQSALLVRELYALDAGRSALPSLRALRRARNTPSQTSCADRAERLKNVRGSFAACGEAVHGRNVILLDDVITTGATMREARRALKQAGARRIIGIAVAH